MREIEVIGHRDNALERELSRGSTVLHLANQNGGRDNISVVLVKVPKAFLPSAAWAQRYLAKKRAG